jgi:hypothetical protein
MSPAICSGKRNVILAIVIIRSHLKNKSRHLFENIAYTGDGFNK